MMDILVNDMKITCCRNCKKRSLGCHSSCEEYIKQRAMLTETKEKERDINLYMHERHKIRLDFDAELKQHRRKLRRN